MEERLLCYLFNNGVVNIYDNNGIPVYGFGENDEISSWKLNIRRPTKEELNRIDEKDLRKYKLMKTKERIKNNELYPFIQKLLDKLKIDFDELI